MKMNVLVEQICAHTGKVKKTVKAHNVVLTTGKRLFFEQNCGCRGIGIGSDGTAAQASDTALITEVATILFGNPPTQNSVVDNVFTTYYTFADWSSSYTIREAGIRLHRLGDYTYFYGYFNRVVLDTPVTVDCDNNIKISIEVTIS